MSRPIGKNNSSNRNVWLKRTLQGCSDGSRILDAGAGELRHKNLCTHLEYVSQDFCQYQDGKDKSGLQHKKWNTSKIDIVSDIVDMPIEDISFDIVMCVEVLEHIPDPLAAIREMSRILKVGGKLILTAPFNSLTHFSPFYYATGFSRNFYEYHLAEQGFKIKDMYFNGNFYEYMAQELRRVPKISVKYSGTKITKTEQFKINETIKILDSLNKKDSSSNELLCHGLNVLAIKEK